MAAIVRVKRRRDEDAADSLLLGLLCKKSKTVSAEPSSGEDTEEIKSVFKYAGTVSTKVNCK